MSGEELAIVIMRMFERILSVGLGGLTIYFGYRLFLQLPTQTNSEGKLELPGTSVVLSKVGPGVFFLAFGAIVIYQSFSSPITVGGEEGDFSGAASRMEHQQVSPPFGSEVSGPEEAFVSPQDLDRLKRTLQVLNCAGNVLAGVDSGIPEEEIERSIRDAKLVLMEAKWMTGLWGSRPDFIRWVNFSEGTANQEVLTYYDATQPGCPVAEPEGSQG